MIDHAPFVSADVAAASLGVSRATLYAYVSRKLIRTREVAGDPRKRLYSVGDIEALKTRKKQNRAPGEAAASTLDWGLPVLDSAITLIEDGRLYFRGHPAGTWAEDATLEETARLLWQCGDHDPFADPASMPPHWDAALLAGLRSVPLVERCQALLLLAPAGRAIMWQRDGRRLWSGAAALVRAMAAAASNTQPEAEPVHQHLAQAWSLSQEGADRVSRALVLLADHEFNASAFAVRVVASTGASLGACLNAGLGALSGPLHGGMTSLVEIFFDEVLSTGDAASVIEARLRRGDGVPGFGHPLYPQGDPRCNALLPLLPPDPMRDSIAVAMQEGAGRAPTIDFALVSLRRAYGLPPGAALALFAIGRAVGWIAHALEQRREDRLIRPRARYVGPAPAERG